MASLEEQFEAACAAGDISGVVLVARDIEGGAPERLSLPHAQLAKSLSCREIHISEGLRAEVSHGGDGRERYVHPGVVHEDYDVHRGPAVRGEGPGRAG